MTNPDPWSPPEAILDPPPPLQPSASELGKSSGEYGVELHGSNESWALSLFPEVARLVPSAGSGITVSKGEVVEGAGLSIHIHRRHVMGTMERSWLLTFRGVKEKFILDLRTAAALVKWSGDSSRLLNRGSARRWWIFIVFGIVYGLVFVSRRDPMVFFVLMCAVAAALVLRGVLKRVASYRVVIFADLIQAAAYVLVFSYFTLPGLKPGWVIGFVLTLMNAWQMYQRYNMYRQLLVVADERSA